MDIIFAGTPEFGLPCLDALANSSHRVIAVYTQPDRPAGRGQKSRPSAIKLWATDRQIPVYQPTNFRSEESLNTLRKLQPDLMVVIAYGLILPQKVLSIPKLGCVNVHASLLPRWRGAAPIQYAILHGDEKTGITIMQMDVGMDTGPCLSQVICSIRAEDTATQLHDRLSQAAVQPLLSSIEALERGTAKIQAQDSVGVTYASKIEKKNAKINWARSAVEINNQIRAFNPWPVAYTQAGTETFRVYKAKVIEDAALPSAKPGTILALDKKGMLVMTGKDVLQVESLQFPGSRAMTVADWLNAGRKKLHIGLCLR